MLVSALGLQQSYMRGVKAVSFGVCLPKHHAEAGRVSLYDGYFYFTGFAGSSRGTAAGSDMEEEASGAARGSSITSGSGSTDSQQLIGKRKPTS